MNSKQLEQYRSELNMPYTDEEMSLHLMDRDVKSLLELTHAENYYLIRLTKEWIAFVHKGGTRPTRNIWKYLLPGSNNENSACDRLNQLVEYYSQFDYGQAPILPIAFFCSRSTMTLLQLLEELHFTTHLDRAERAAKDFFTIITNEGKTDYSRQQLQTLLRKCIDDFVSACEKNAEALHEYLLDIIRGIKRQKPATPEDLKRIIAPIISKQDAEQMALSEISSVAKRNGNLIRETLWHASGKLAQYKPSDKRSINAIKETMVQMAIDRIHAGTSASPRAILIAILGQYEGVPGAYDSLSPFLRQVERVIKKSRHSF